MLATFIIVFREIIEAGLVVGIVLAATRGVSRRGFWVASGVGAGILGACVVAACAGSISAAMEGFGQEVFNIAILLMAVAMLAWHNVWMARHGREIASEMKAVGAAVTSGSRSLMALAIVVGVAVLREGSEVVLFLYGIAISGEESALTMALGGAAGILAGMAVSAITYLGLLRIPNRHLFAVTGWMITLLAAGMASQAVALMQQAEIVTVLSQTVWDSSGFIANASVLGKALRTLVGYTDTPSALQLLVYGVTLVGISTLMRLFGHAPKQPSLKVAVASYSLSN